MFIRGWSQGGGDASGVAMVKQTFNVKNFTRSSANQWCKDPVSQVRCSSTYLTCFFLLAAFLAWARAIDFVETVGGSLGQLANFLGTGTN